MSCPLKFEYPITNKEQDWLDCYNEYNKSVGFWYCERGLFDKGLHHLKNVFFGELTLEKRRSFCEVYVKYLVTSGERSCYFSLMQLLLSSNSLEDPKLNLKMLLFAESQEIKCPLLKCDVLMKVGGKRVEEAIGILHGIVNRKTYYGEDMIFSASFTLGKFYESRGSFIKARQVYSQAKGNLKLAEGDIGATYHMEKLNWKIEKTSSKIVKKLKNKHFSIW